MKIIAKNFEKMINHCAIENKTELSYCIMNLNLKTLKATFAVKGISSLFYLDEIIHLDQPIKLNLKPKDRLCFISEGSIKNWELFSKYSNKKFFVDNQNLSSKDLLNEYFFELSRNKTGNFLVYDSIMAILNIEENILYQLS
jgi:hypothetical protein